MISQYLFPEIVSIMYNPFIWNQRDKDEDNKRLKIILSLAQ